MYLYVSHELNVLAYYYYYVLLLSDKGRVGRIIKEIQLLESPIPPPLSQTNVTKNPECLRGKITMMHL